MVGSVGSAVRAAHDMGNALVGLRGFGGLHAEGKHEAACARQEKPAPLTHTPFPNHCVLPCPRIPTVSGSQAFRRRAM
ncbi:hypothetical protein GCM10028812_31760 [Ancylobacter sonchi]